LGGLRTLLKAYDHETYPILLGLLVTSGVSPAQSLSNTNATSIQGKRVKSPLSCGDTFVLKWVAVNSRFECLAGGGSGSPAGADKQIQYNNAGAFGASSGFTFTSSMGELSLRPFGNRIGSAARLSRCFQVVRQSDQLHAEQRAE